MSLRDILVHVDHSPEGAHRVRLAADLAGRHGAHLTFLHVRERSLDSQAMLKAAELGLMPAAALHRLEDGINARLRNEAAALRSASAAEAAFNGVPCDFDSVAGSCEAVVLQRARYADLVIVQHDGEPNGDMPYGFPFGEAILFATGRPVLLVPPTMASHTLGRRVALAWNGSRPAARALTDAMPIIEHAEETHVLIARPVRPPSSEVLPLDAILAHLQRHCASVSLHWLDVVDGPIGDWLQAEALRLGADVFVAGAYGHPKLWERLVGGVTRDLLTRMRLPMLMAQ